MGIEERIFRYVDQLFECRDTDKVPGGEETPLSSVEANQAMSGK